MTSSKSPVGKGAAYIYVETIISMILGYAFWIVMSKIATTDVVGLSSALITFCGIIAVIANIGIPTGIQRFLGKSFFENRSEESKTYVTTSVILISVSFIACCIFLVGFKDQINQYFMANDVLLLISILLIASLVYASMFRGIVIASLNTKILVPCVAISGITKLVLGVYLVLAGFGEEGVMLSFAINQVLTFLILGIASVSLISWRRRLKTSTFFSTSKIILESSAVFWVPFLISTVGSQLGTIVVFGSDGSNQAGLYFMALTIITGITTVMFSLFTIALPALSAMEDGRKRFTWNTIRLSAILILPLTTALIYYSKEILSLLGPAYTESSFSLQIMLLSMLPTVVVYGVNALVYSGGNYRQVLLIGLSTSIPRIVMYLILVPILGASGAAIGYTLGAAIGFLVAVFIARAIKLRIIWTELLVIFTIPLILGISAGYVFQNYVLGILFTTIVSYVCYFLLGILRKKDALSIVNILPNPISTGIILHAKNSRFSKFFFRR